MCPIVWPCVYPCVPFSTQVCAPVCSCVPLFSLRVPWYTLLYPFVPQCAPVLPESRSCDLSSTPDSQPSRREEELRQPVHLEPPLRGRGRRGHTSTYYLPPLLAAALFHVIQGD
ncbi:hypothetical protein E2C01_041765 [Portunus trituberculatus]|uniref:Uncharacterized protein n=1 Tax=Portunus trituberculatus TaxID=210409 RepID=A0A5B7FKQ6_PORTR|nr:hypothetical protein [Portunus trituberculatus]